MATIPEHDFFLQLISNIVENIEQVSKQDETKYAYVMKTTGPLMLNKFYQNYELKEHINLIASELICPLDSNETKENLERIKKCGANVSKASEIKKLTFQLTI